jgi:hypothetical protein
VLVQRGDPLLGGHLPVAAHAAGSRLRGEDSVLVSIERFRDGPHIT